MTQLTPRDVSSRDVAYHHGTTKMLGQLIAPASPAPEPAPTVVLLHDAYGFGPSLVDTATRIAQAGYTVFLADLWGNRAAPASPDDIGPSIGGMLADREEWQGRVAAAHRVAAEQPEVQAAAMVSLGYCFGGSSALEFVRTGGEVRGAIAVHAGLDLVEWDWAAARPQANVLVLTGADDPMATPEQRASLETALNSAEADWELQVYSGTVHAFTSERSRNSPVPHLFQYHERSTARAWAATLQALHTWLSNG